MQNKYATTALKAAVLLGVSLFAADVLAIQMGEMSAHSRIGEPLNATVGLWLGPRDKALPIRFKISPDVSYRNNTRLTEIVSRMEARLEHNDGGIPYVRISTDTPISEPIVAFRLKVFAGDVAIMRNFALALNPASVSPKPRASTARTQPRSIPTSVIDGPTYTVSRGDTLWGIARRVSRTNGASTVTVAEQIFAANPDAFVNGNQDKLMLGARLNLPGALSVDSTAPVRETVAVESARRETSAAEPPAATPAPSTTTVMTAAVDEQASAVAQTPRKTVQWQELNPELAAELDALKAKYANLRARYGTQSARTTAAPAAAGLTSVTESTVDDAPAASPSQLETESPSVAQPALPVVAERQSEPPAITASDAGQSVLVEDVAMGADTKAIGGWTSSPLKVALFALLAIAVIAGIITVYMGARRGVIGARSRHAELRYDELEKKRKAEVARKAKNRIEMETEVKRMLEQRRGGGSAGGNQEQAAAAASMAALTAGNKDAEAEIDQSIAHGRYAEAETLLTEVIAATPRNYSAKLRLIEVYYMTERIDEFCQLADDLHHNHRSDMADEEWQRVVRMGKIVAPDRPPFSGPRAVGDPTQIS